jgi:hypothetical protein
LVYSQQHQSVKRLYWVGYYRKFIKGYGSIYKPLNKLLKKDVFERDDEATAALKLLNKVMTKPLVIALLDLNKIFVVESDASVMGIEAILMQEGHLITLIIKLSGQRQQGSSIYEIEILVIL